MYFFAFTMYLGKALANNTVWGYTVKLIIVMVISEISWQDINKKFYPVCQLWWIPDPISSCAGKCMWQRLWYI